MFSVGTHVWPSGGFLSSQVIRPAALGGCQQNPQDKHKLLVFLHFLLHCTTRPSSTHPSSLFFNPHLHCSSLSADLWSHLSSMHIIRCVKDSLFTLYGAIVLQWKHSVQSPLTQLSLQSVFQSQSRSEEGGPEIHLLQISTNALLILPADGLALVLYNFSPFLHTGNLCSSGGNPVLKFVSQQKFTHQLHTAINLITTMPDKDAINQEDLERKPVLLFFSHIITTFWSCESRSIWRIAKHMY